MLPTGEQKSSHITKGFEGLRGHFCTKPSVSPDPCMHAVRRQKIQVFGGLGATVMPGLRSMQQLRLVTSLMQNVTTAP